MESFEFSRLVLFCYRLLTLLCSLKELHASLSTPGVIYERFNGIKLLNPCIVSNARVRSVVACCVQCSATSGCRAGSFEADGTCCLSNVFAYDGGASYEESQTSVYFQLPADVVWYGEWALVFRAIAGIALPVYKYWQADGTHNDLPVSRLRPLLGCVTMNISKTCKTHFRSGLLDEWTSLGVREVRLNMYKNGFQVLNVIFNGSGSTRNSWFSYDRVLQSPWNDLPKVSSGFISFSIEGLNSRRYFINSAYKGCDADTGWLVIIDLFDPPRSPCPWEDKLKPAFLFSNQSNVIVWQDNKQCNEMELASRHCKHKPDVFCYICGEYTIVPNRNTATALGQADVFAIFVKYDAAKYK